MVRIAKTSRYDLDLVADLKQLVGKDIHDARHTVIAFRVRKIAALKMGMSVEVIARLGNAQEPVNRS